MAIKSGLFNSVNGDRRYKADFFAEYFASFIANGVFPNPSAGLQVIANGNMTISIRAGKAWIKGYYFANDSDYVLQHDVADGVLKRIDRIVLRLDFSDRQIVPLVKKGTFASSPAAPTLQRDADAYEIALADVLINNGAISITQANITDLRLNTSLCGIVKGVVDQINTTNLFAQYDASFADWFESIKDILDGDVAANLANRISSLEQTLASHKADEAHVRWLGTTGGTANALTVTNSEIVSYKDGLGVSFAVGADSTAAVTLKINTLAAIPIKKANGGVVSNLKDGGVYTVRYSNSSFILQGEGGSGDATPNDIRMGKTATTDNGDIIGALDLTEVKPENIKEGVDIGGVVGSLKPITVTPSYNPRISMPKRNLIYNLPNENYKGLTFPFKGKIRLRYTAESGNSNNSEQQRVSVFHYSKNGAMKQQYTDAIANFNKLNITRDIPVDEGDYLVFIAYLKEAGWMAVSNVVYSWDGYELPIARIDMSKTYYEYPNA